MAAKFKKDALEEVHELDAIESLLAGKTKCNSVKKMHFSITPFHFWMSVTHYHHHHWSAVSLKISRPSADKATNRLKTAGSDLGGLSQPPRSVASPTILRQKVSKKDPSVIFQLLKPNPSNIKLQSFWKIPFPLSSPTLTVSVSGRITISISFCWFGIAGTSA